MLRQRKIKLLFIKSKRGPNQKRDCLSINYVLQPPEAENQET